MADSFEELIAIEEGKGFSKEEFFLYVNLFLFLKFAEHLDTLKGEKIKRIKYYFSNAFDILYNSSFKTDFLETLIDFSNFKNNILIEAMFNSLNISPSYLDDVDSRKRVVFIIMIAVLFALNGYREIVRLLRKPLSFAPNLESKIKRLAESDCSAFLQELNAGHFNRIIQDKQGNYISVCEKMVRSALEKSQYHNHIKLRQFIRYGNDIDNNYKNLKNLDFIMDFSHLRRVYRAHMKSEHQFLYEKAFFRDLPKFLANISQYNKKDTAPAISEN